MLTSCCVDFVDVFDLMFQLWSNKTLAPHFLAKSAGRRREFEAMNRECGKEDAMQTRPGMCTMARMLARSIARLRHA